jgi:uncharacterized protein (UPF0276 family)
VSAAVRGVGLGLRWEFIDAMVRRTIDDEENPRPGAVHANGVDFIEVCPENYIRRGGQQPELLDWLASRYPVVTHGLTMSLGGFDPLDEAYLGELQAFVRRVHSPSHSDHLSFTGSGGRMLHELLPVSFKRSNVLRVADRIRRARESLGIPLAIENVTYYWHPGRADLREADFLAAVCEAADCGFLLDVNNAYVNATNFGFDIDGWLRSAPIDRVVQIHVAGHEWFDVDERGVGLSRPAQSTGAMIIDTHGSDVIAPVLDLLERVLALTGPVPVVLERDQNIPSFDALLTEVARIRSIYARVIAS